MSKPNATKVEVDVVIAIWVSGLETAAQRRNDTVDALETALSRLHDQLHAEVQSDLSDAGGTVEGVEFVSVGPATMVGDP